MFYHLFLNTTKLSKFYHPSIFVKEKFNLIKCGKIFENHRDIISKQGLVKFRCQSQLKHKKKSINLSPISQSSNAIKLNHNSHHTFLNNHRLRKLPRGVKSETSTQQNTNCIRWNLICFSYAYDIKIQICAPRSALSLPCQPACFNINDSSPIARVSRQKSPSFTYKAPNFNSFQLHASIIKVTFILFSTLRFLKGFKFQFFSVFFDSKCDFHRWQHTLENYLAEINGHICVLHFLFRNAPCYCYFIEMCKCFQNISAFIYLFFRLQTFTVECTFVSDCTYI